MTRRSCDKQTFLDKLDEIEAVCPARFSIGASRVKLSKKQVINRMRLDEHGRVMFGKEYVKWILDCRTQAPDGRLGTVVIELEG